MKTLLFCILTLSLLNSTSALAAGNDELWEVSTKMDMAGMPFAMPGQTSEVCMKKGENDPNKTVPQEKDQNCKMSDVKTSGNKSSWKMKCSGKEPMTGSGEMTYGKDTYSGKVKMHSADGDMTMTYSGKRIGSCDFTAQHAKVDAQIKKSKADSDALMKQIQQQQQKNCDQQRKASTTYEGYRGYDDLYGKKSLSQHDAKTQREVRASLKTQQADCPINYKANLKTLCKKAEADGEINFAVDFCPAEARALKAKHCQGGGRSYTTYGYLCDGHRAEDDGSEDSDSGPASRGDSAQSADKDNPAKSILDGAKNLKGLFGF